MSDTANTQGQEQPTMLNGLETLEDSLSDQQREVYTLLTTLLDGSESDEGSLAYLFAGLEDTLDDLREDFLGALPGASLLEGSGAGGGVAAALGGGAAGSGFPSRAIKAAPQLHPKPEHLMQLPVEFSMGYLLIYDQLVKMSGTEGTAKKEKKESRTSGGIGGFFSNLLKGAEGLALIAVGLIAFTGAMILFQFIQWEPAMTGLIAFGLFVLGMTTLS